MDNGTPPHRTPHFAIPMNLPHAGKVAVRILELVERRAKQTGEPAPPGVLAEARDLVGLLAIYRVSGENPSSQECAAVAMEAAACGRRLVAEIEDADARSDRMGQCVRNLFECLEMGVEGARISLRAGEDPRSLQRPV